MKKRSRFLPAYLIFLTVCIALSAAFLVYVHCVVKEYDNAQPERVVEQQLQRLKTMSQDGSLSKQLGFDELCTNRYERNDPDAYAQSYAKKLNGELTYEFVAAQSSDMKKAYSVLADGVPVGRLTLSGTNSRTSLFFFSMADWSIDSYEPYFADTVYNLMVYRPDGMKVLINGTEPSEEERDAASEIPLYSVKGLLNEPRIEYHGEGGEIVPYTTQDNTVMPILYSYPLRLPAGIGVEINGKPAAGIPTEDGQLVYTVCEMEPPKVSISDVYGKRYTYLGEFEADFYTYTVTVPEDHTVTINGINAEELGTVKYMEHADAQVLLEKAGVQLVNTKSCTFTLLTKAAAVEVTDSSGAMTSYALSEPSLVIGTEVGSETVPEDIAAQLDVLEIAKTWSRFMTDDLEGDTHGLAQVQQYFIKDSDYYRYAEEWATGPDIKFTSLHTIDSFTNESVTDFIRYGEDCFSCEVYFEKNMSLLFEDRFAGYRTDIFHSIMYFLYIDDTPDNGIDDPHWAIAVMHDVL